VQQQRTRLSDLHLIVCSETQSHFLCAGKNVNHFVVFGGKFRLPMNDKLWISKMLAMPS
jgi:hypothetical protein